MKHTPRARNVARFLDKGKTIEIDARLCCAAPDLLEACKYLLDQEISFDGNNAHKALEMIRKAIAKAKGK